MRLFNRTVRVTKVSGHFRRSDGKHHHISELIVAWLELAACLYAPTHIAQTTSTVTEPASAGFAPVTTYEVTTLSD